VSAKNPLEALLIEERDVPAAREAYNKYVSARYQKLGDKIDAAVTIGLRKIEKTKRLYEIRRTFVRGGIIDVIGSGESARIWMGTNDKSLPWCTLDQNQMKDLITRFNEALRS